MRSAKPDRAEARLPWLPEGFVARFCLSQFSS
jgi:hypothetical protein